MLTTKHNTLFLLVVIAVVIAPHVPQLPGWCVGFSAVALLWRGSIAYRGWTMPKRWIVLLALVGCVWGVFVSHATLLGPTAGTTLVVALLALKTLELRAQRDIFVVFFLSFFVLIANFLESQSLVIALAMVVGMGGLLACLVNAQLSHEPTGFTTAIWQATKLMVWGAPLMVLLFVLFPRVAPLWALPSGAASGQTGLSDNMTVGRIAQLAKNDAIAMRVRFDGPPPKVSDLYFRGPILSQFDGQTWNPSAVAPPMREMPEALVQGSALHYEVTLEPHQRDWLMTLDVTPQMPDWPNHTMAVSHNFQWYSQQPITEVVRYKAVGYTQYQYGWDLTERQLAESLFVPSNSNPRLQALAAQQLADPVFRASSAINKVNWVVQQLASGAYRYTLEPGVFGRHSADEFWFDRKEGFCEHIAASFVILMRALGVPARVVTGYQGGELNAVDGFWLVRQSDAHAWAEVWLPPGSAQGQGWIRVDPTGAVAPARLRNATRLEPQPGPVGNAVNRLLGGQGIQWWRQARGLWEASENFWTQKILNFNRDRQFELLKEMGLTTPSDETLIQVIASLFALGLLVFVVLGKIQPWHWLRWYRQDPWLRLWAQVQRQAKARGCAVDASTTPRQLAAWVRQTRVVSGGSSDAQIQATADWLIRLEMLRYAHPLSSSHNHDAWVGSALAEMRKEWKKLGFN